MTLKPFKQATPSPISLKVKKLHQRSKRSKKRRNKSKSRRSRLTMFSMTSLKKSAKMTLKKILAMNLTPVRFKIRLKIKT